MLYVGGAFNNFSPALTPANFFASIGSPTDITGNNVFTEVGGGVSGGLGATTIYALYFDTTTNYLQVGGDFTTIDPLGLATNMNYGAMYYPATGLWSYPFANNLLDAPVYSIKPTHGGYLFITGAFNAPSPNTEPYSLYALGNDVETTYQDTGLFLTTPPNFKQAYGLSGSPTAVMNGTNLFVSNSLSVWEDLGDPTGSGAVSGINIFGNGNWKVIYTGTTYVRSHTTLPHSCEFQGSFKYDNNTYTKYTITTRNVSQQFIGDATNTFWSIIGQGVGAFS